MSSPRRSLEARFWEKVRTGTPEVCWPWTAAVQDSTGYGMLCVLPGQLPGVLRKRPVSAHRVAWFLTHHELPPLGLTLDHRCHSEDAQCRGGATCPHRRCVNPDHLRVLTDAENKSLIHHANSFKTHCPQGHAYTTKNTYLDQASGARRCKICLANQQRARNARKKGGS